jgi:hypothetical protein
MIQTQTFEFKDKEELAVLSAALNFMAKKQYQEAVEVLIKRHDQLTANPKLKLYA